MACFRQKESDRLLKIPIINSAVMKNFRHLFRDITTAVAFFVLVGVLFLSPSYGRNSSEYLDFSSAYAVYISKPNKLNDETVNSDIKTEFFYNVVPFKWGDDIAWGASKVCTEKEFFNFLNTQEESLVVFVNTPIDFSFAEYKSQLTNDKIHFLFPYMTEQTYITGGQEYLMPSCLNLIRVSQDGASVSINNKIRLEIKNSELIDVISSFVAKTHKGYIYIYEEGGKDWPIYDRFVLGEYVHDKFRTIDIANDYKCFDLTNPGILEDGHTVRMLDSDGVDMYVWY